MKSAVNHACAICGSEDPGKTWFLVASNRWQDRLGVMHWNEALANSGGLYHACSARHVEELVVHWMVTGSLEYPFAHAALSPDNSAAHAGEPEQPDIAAGHIIGELIVHRQSLPRVLSDNPYALAPLLEALVKALQEDGAEPRPGDDLLDELCLVT